MPATGLTPGMLSEAITLRADVEKLASAEAQKTGEYLRPILLLQAERVSDCEPLREQWATEFGTRLISESVLPCRPRALTRRAGV